MTVTKIIWTLWFQGWTVAPEMYKRCLNSWIDKNPTWMVRALDADSLKQYIPDFNKYLGENNIIDSTQVSLTHKSDIVRVVLLNEYGGIWVDASVYCYQPLDEWLPTNSGFFAFNQPGPDRPLSNWLIYSEADNRLLQLFTVQYFNWWSVNKSVVDYFIFHHLFDELLRKNTEFAALWAAVTKISADIPHSIYGYYSQVATPTVLSRISISPVYKTNIKHTQLSHNTVIDLCTNGTLVDAIRSNIRNANRSTQGV